MMIALLPGNLPCPAFEPRNLLPSRLPVAYLFKPNPMVIRPNIVSDNKHNNNKIDISSISLPTTFSSAATSMSRSKAATLDPRYAGCQLSFLLTTFN